MAGSSGVNKLSERAYSQASPAPTSEKGLIAEGLSQVPLGGTESTFNQGYRPSTSGKATRRSRILKSVWNSATSLLPK